MDKTQQQQAGQPDRQKAPVAANQPRENLVRYNYHEDNEGLINRQINLELYASYAYMAMAHHFDRSDVALKGHYEFFKKMSEEEREHANKFMEYQNKRGGTIVLLDIKKPTQQSWSSALEAHETALQLEKDVYQALLELHSYYGTHGVAPQLLAFLTHLFPYHNEAMSMAALGGGNGSSNSSSHHSTNFNNPADLGVDDIHLSSHHLFLLEAKDEVLQVLKSDLMEALNKEVKSLDEDNWMFEGPRSRVNLVSNPGRSYATRNA